MRPDFRTFRYSSRAKILIHHGGRTDQKGRIDKKQAHKSDVKFDNCQEIKCRVVFTLNEINIGFI